METKITQVRDQMQDIINRRDKLDKDERIK